MHWCHRSPAPLWPPAAAQRARGRVPGVLSLGAARCAPGSPCPASGGQLIAGSHGHRAAGHVPAHDRAVGHRGHRGSVLAQRGQWDLWVSGVLPHARHAWGPRLWPCPDPGNGAMDPGPRSTGMNRCRLRVPQASGSAWRWSWRAGTPAPSWRAGAGSGAGRRWRRSARPPGTPRWCCGSWTRARWPRCAPSPAPCCWRSRVWTCWSITPVSPVSASATRGVRPAPGPTSLNPDRRSRAALRRHPRGAGANVRHQLPGPVPAHEPAAG